MIIECSIARADMLYQYGVISPANFLMNSCGRMDHEIRTFSVVNVHTFNAIRDEIGHTRFDLAIKVISA
jgi:hypothetical protein